MATREELDRNGIPLEDWEWLNQENERKPFPMNAEYACDDQIASVVLEDANGDGAAVLAVRVDGVWYRREDAKFDKAWRRYCIVCWDQLQSRPRKVNRGGRGRRELIPNPHWLGYDETEGDE